MPSDLNARQIGAHRTRQQSGHRRLVSIVVQARQMPNAQAGCQSEYRAARRDIVLGHQIERSPDLGAVTPQLILDHVLGGEHETLVIGVDVERSEEHTSELQSLMRISYA